MRIVLVVHGFPPHECTGVETHVQALARALARRGLEVEVFSTRADPRAPEFSLRSEMREGFRLTWVVQNRVPGSAREHTERPGAVAAFAEFLERTRPDLVHFHHAHKLGIGVLEQAARRGLPSLYTAHDYFPVCHRVLLARPDLERCQTPGEAGACARCDSAVAYLDGLERWSDWQAGVFAADLAPEERGELARRLQREGGALEERAALDRRRQQAFAALDVVLAPSAFLRRQLIEGGLDPARIEASEYAIETAALQALPAPRDGSDAPLRFGYLGGAHKHKGVHVLLEAFATLGKSAQLHIHADSSDREHVARLRARAAAVGAHWHGAYRAEQLAQVLAGMDVVVVPSIWWENSPFVIREAQAAARPVIASDLPALRELLQQDSDGLLFAPGDATALATAMRSLIDDPKLCARLSRNAAMPRSLEELCDELIGRYQGLIAQRVQGLPESLPDSARRFAQRVQELERASVDELAQRALGGLGALAHSLGAPLPDAAPGPGEALAIERLRDARREIRWRVAQDDGGLALREARNTQQELASTLEAAHDELARARDDDARARAALAAAVGELEQRAQQVAALERAQLDARAALQSEQTAHAGARAALAAARQALDQAGQERASLARELEQQQAQLQSSLAQLERSGLRAAELEGQLGAQALGFAALERHALWLEAEAAALARRFGPAADALRRPEDFLAAHAAWQRLDDELRWRRSEMAALREDGGRLVRALLARSALGRRLRTWEGGA